MLKKSIPLFVLAVVAGSAAEAQVIRGGLGGPKMFVGAGGPVTLTPGYGYGNAATAGEYAPANGPAYVPPYSYYAVPPAYPARVYQGPDVFPFYGRPYGHPFDRWTWPYISGGADANLARYYYPPLG